MLPAPFFNEFPSDLACDRAWIDRLTEREDLPAPPLDVPPEPLRRLARVIAGRGSGAGSPRPGR